MRITGKSETNRPRHDLGVDIAVKQVYRLVGLRTNSCAAAAKWLLVTVFDSAPEPLESKNLTKELPLG